MNQIEPGVQYNYVYEDDEYMIQEEEWDRDLLLDPAWEKQQRKVSKGPVPAVCGLGPRVRVSRSPRGLAHCVRLRVGAWWRCCVVPCHRSPRAP